MTNRRKYHGDTVKLQRQAIPLDQLGEELRARHEVMDTRHSDYDKPNSYAIGRMLLNEESISELVTFLETRLDTSPRRPFLPYIPKRTIHKNGLDAHQLLDAYRLSEHGDLSQQPYTCRVQGLVCRGRDNYIALNLGDDGLLADEMWRLGQHIPKYNRKPLDVVLAYYREPLETVRSIVQEGNFVAPIPSVVDLGELAVRTYPGLYPHPQGPDNKM